MLENLTNNVTLCYKLGGKLTALELIRCVICTGFSTLQGETANFGFASFCIKVHVICEGVLWCIFMSLWLKRFQCFPTGLCLANENTTSAPGGIYAWHCVPLPSNRPAGGRNQQVLDSNTFSQNVGTNFKETQSVLWGSYNELLESNIPRWIPGGIPQWLKYKRPLAVFPKSFHSRFHGWYGYVGLAPQRMSVPNCSRPQRLTVSLAELTVLRNHPAWTLGQTRGNAGQGGE